MLVSLGRKCSFGLEQLMYVVQTGSEAPPLPLQPTDCSIAAAVAICLGFRAVAAVSWI